MILKKTIITSILTFFFLFNIALTAQANTVNVTGTASVTYSKFTPEVREGALQIAKETAWKKYTASFTAGKKKQYKKLKNDFLGNLDDFIIETIVQQEKDIEDSKRFKIAIQVIIDSGAVNEMFNSSSIVGNSAAGESSDFGSLFIARVVTSQKNFEKRVTKVEKSESNAVVQEENASDVTSSVDSIDQKSISSTQTGGSTQQKRAKVTYEPNADIGEDVAYTIEEFLADAGFEPMSVDELTDYGAPFLDEIYGEMRDSARLSSRTLKVFKSAAIDAGWTFFGMGTIDIGAQQEDADRGMIKVPAKVSYKVWMLTDGRAKAVASVRPTTIFGYDAEDPLVAESMAANKAAQLALETVVAQLQAKNLY